ncbi:MAG: DUF4339 domain-containing protein [Pirellulaceae bacterium]|nr:DUF4339 domain-containing protein [Pirellulaceae bacterium]
MADHHAGKTARCPACQTLYKVPLAGQTGTGQTGTGQTGTGPYATGNLHGPASRRWLLKTDDGQVYGPVDRFELDGWVVQGRVTPSAQVQQEGDSFWQSAAAVYPELQVREPVPGRAANPFADAPANGPWAAASGVAGHVPVSRRYAEPHRGGLVLALGLIGWVLGCPFVAPFAIVLGVIDLRKMSEGRMDPSGKGLTIAGVVLGGIYLTLAVGFVLLIMLLALFE